MLRTFVFAGLVALAACGGDRWQGGGRGGGGGGGGGGGDVAAFDEDGFPTAETLPDVAHDDDVDDLAADEDDIAGDVPTGIDSLAPSIAPSRTFDEVVGTSESALTSDCPEARNLAQFAGPASWPQNYGVKGLCVASRYACRMPTKDPDFRRYENPSDAVDGAWPIAVGIPVLDGRGHAIGTTTVDAAKLNFGQRKPLGGKQHVYAFSVGSGASDVSGWVPAACIGWDGKTVPAASCAQSSGSTPSDFPVFNGRKPGKLYGATNKYTIITPAEIIQKVPQLANIDPDKLKITCNAPDAPHRSLADYLPQLSADGTFYKVNLLANVPGISPALGGIASDTLRVAHVVNGTMISDGITFHALQHVRAIAVYLFAPNSSVGAPVEHAHVSFLYGYVLYPHGSGWLRRYGWLPAYAVRPSP